MQTWQQQKLQSQAVYDASELFLVEAAPEGGFTARAFGVDIFADADDLASPRAPWMPP